ncbi:MAG: hypothetical protein FWF41_04890 [Betaproteobacteria bacterium]|nr:hypothetical protein [Betaproteobacteria bacterium]
MKLPLIFRKSPESINGVLDALRVFVGTPWLAYSFFAAVVGYGVMEAHAAYPAVLDGAKLLKLSEAQAISSERQRPAFSVKDWSDSLGDGVVLFTPRSFQREVVVKEGGGNGANNPHESTEQPLMVRKCDQEFVYQRFQCEGFHPVKAFAMSIAYYLILVVILVVLPISIGAGLSVGVYWLLFIYARKNKRRSLGEGI